MFCVYNKGFGGEDRYMFWFDSYEDAEGAFIDYLERNRKVREQVEIVEENTNNKEDVFDGGVSAVDEAKQVLFNEGKNSGLLNFSKLLGDRESDKEVKIEKGTVKCNKERTGVTCEADDRFWPDNFYDIDIIDVKGIFPLECYRGKHNKLKLEGHYIFFVNKKKPLVVSDVLNDYIGRIDNNVLYKASVAKQLLKDNILRGYKENFFRYSVSNDRCTLLS